MMGPEPGRAGGGGGKTCVFLHKNVHRNMLQYSFGAVFRGKKPVFFTRFFREVPNFSLDMPDFSRGKNPAKSREKSGAITGRQRLYGVS